MVYGSRRSREIIGGNSVTAAEAATELPVDIDTPLIIYIIHKHFTHLQAKQRL